MNARADARDDARESRERRGGQGERHPEKGQAACGEAASACHGGSRDIGSIYCCTVPGMENTAAFPRRPGDGVLDGESRLGALGGFRDGSLIGVCSKDRKE